MVENWNDYVELQKEGLALFPTAIHIAKKPGDVTEARKQGLQAYVRADSLDKLMTSIDDMSNAHYRWHKPAYPSSGPEICAFMAENWGTSDQAIPGNDRFRLQMMARSPKGLAEVQLFVRGILIRRFLLNGAKEFKQTLDEYHTQQRSFLMVVTDVDGGKALSWDRITEVQECWFLMCGDNMNDMGPGGKITIDTGKLNLLGTECSVTPSGPGSTWPWPMIAARLADGDGSRLTTKPQAAMKDCSLVSRFGMVVNYPLDYNWDGDGTVHAAYPAPLIINPCFSGSYRTYSFARRPPGPNLEIREYVINIKQDMELIETPGLKLMLGSNWKLEEGRLDHIVYFTAEGGRVVESPTRETGRQFNTLTVKPGQYVSIFPTCTTVFPLDEEMYASIDRNPSHRRYVQERVKIDEIIRLGTFDNGVGLLQLDAERGDRDIFIGNLVTCNREDFPLVFHRDGKTGQATIEVHNPTDKEAEVTVKPGKGFDLYGDFSNIVKVPAGSSIIITVAKLLQHN